MIAIYLPLKSDLFTSPAQIQLDKPRSGQRDHLLRHGLAGVLGVDLSTMLFPEGFASQPFDKPAAPRTPNTTPNAEDTDRKHHFPALNPKANRRTASNSGAPSSHHSSFRHFSSVHSLLPCRSNLSNGQKTRQVGT